MTSRRISSPAFVPIAFAALLVGACVASGDKALATEITYACSGVGGVSPADAATICGEFAEVLAENYPAKTFSAGSEGAPRIALTVTYASPRGVGLAVDWIAADGSKTSGLPLQTSFYDRNADTELRKRFFKTFLQSNPLPF